MAGSWQLGWRHDWHGCWWLGCVCVAVRVSVGVGGRVARIMFVFMPSGENRVCLNVLGTRFVLIN